MTSGGSSYGYWPAYQPKDEERRLFLEERRLLFEWQAREQKERKPYGKRDETLMNANECG